VDEFFPTAGVTPFHDPGLPAVSLAFVVAVIGGCRPQQDALDLSWVTPEEARSLAARGKVAGSHAVLVRQALAHVGFAVGPTARCPIPCTRVQIARRCADTDTAQPPSGRQYRRPPLVAPSGATSTTAYGNARRSDWSGPQLRTSEHHVPVLTYRVGHASSADSTAR
jgi:hypothetical protein